MEKGLQAVLRPKTPDYSAPGENVEINRISLAPTINECIKGLGNENDFNTKERKIYAYKILVEEGDESLYDSNYLYFITICSMINFIFRDLRWQVQCVDWV